MYHSSIIFQKQILANIKINQIYQSIGDGWSRVVWFCWLGDSITRWYCFFWSRILQYLPPLSSCPSRKPQPRSSCWDSRWNGRFGSWANSTYSPSSTCGTRTNSPLSLPTGNARFTTLTLLLSLLQTPGLFKFSSLLTASIILVSISSPQTMMIIFLPFTCLSQIYLISIWEFILCYSYPLPNLSFPRCWPISW